MLSTLTAGCGRAPAPAARATRTLPLPPQTVLRIDALIGERGFVGRSEAIRAIIEAGLRAQS
jgi:hypothetical protein